MNGLFSSASDHVDEIVPCPTALMLLRTCPYHTQRRQWPGPLGSLATPPVRSLMHLPVSLQAPADADTYDSSFGAETYRPVCQECLHAPRCRARPP